MTPCQVNIAGFETYAAKNSPWAHRVHANKVPRYPDPFTGVSAAVIQVLVQMLSKCCESLCLHHHLLRRCVPDSDHPLGGEEILPQIPCNPYVSLITLYIFIESSLPTTTSQPQHSLLITTHPIPGNIPVDSAPLSSLPLPCGLLYVAESSAH